MGNRTSGLDSRPTRSPMTTDGAILRRALANNPKDNGLGSRAARAGDEAIRRLLVIGLTVSDLYDLAARANCQARTIRSGSSCCGMVYHQMFYHC